MTDRPTPGVQEPLAPGVGDGGGPLPAGALTDDERRQRRETVGWRTAGRLYRARWFVLAVTFVAAVTSIVVSLQMPVWYASSTRLLAPEGGGGGLGALIGDLSPIARGVLGGGGGDYTRYLTILSSRPTRERVVEQFDLEAVYDVQDEEHPREEALKRLDDNLDASVDLELEFLEITAYDPDPERAAQIANFLAGELNDRYAELSTSGASSFRRYIEDRYDRATLALDSARAEMRAFQERNGVIELPTMASAYAEALATQRAGLAQVELQYRALLSQFGPDNPDVEAAREAYETARSRQQELLAGQDQALPLAYRQLPALGSRYAALYQDVLIQTQIIETVLPILEQARFDEERERVAVQVISEAVPPVRKARPRRSIIVIVSTLSAGLLAIALVLAVPGVRHVRREILPRLRAS